jgi:hypothetical protein
MLLHWNHFFVFHVKNFSFFFLTLFGEWLLVWNLIDHYASSFINLNYFLLFLEKTHKDHLFSSSVYEESFCVNCNVIMMLLHVKNLSFFLPAFLCEWLLVCNVITDYASSFITLISFFVIWNESLKRLFFSANLSGLKRYFFPSSCVYEESLCSGYLMKVSAFIMH